MVESAAVYPMDAAVALGAPQSGERRIPHHPPAHAHENRSQRAQDQHIADNIGKGGPRQKSSGHLIQMPGTVQSYRGHPPEPRDERAPDTQPLEDQKNPQGNDDQPDDLEPVGSQKPARLALAMVVVLMFAHRSYLSAALTHRRANRSALVDSDAQAINGPGRMPNRIVMSAVAPSATCNGTATLTRSAPSSAGTKNM